MKDILRAFHHPAVRDEHVEIQRNMFNTVKRWVDENPDRHNINSILNSASVKAGRNHKANAADTTHNLFRGLGGGEGEAWSTIQSRDLGSMNDPLSRTGSPVARGMTPDFGYQNQPIAPQQDQGGGYLQPSGADTQGYIGSYEQAAPPMNYQSYGQPSYGQSGSGPFQDPYQQGPPGGFYPGGPQGPPGFPGGPQGGGPFPGPGYPEQQYGQQQSFGQPPFGQPPFGQPPFGQPPYGGPQQQPPGGGYPGSGYGGY